MINKYLLLLFAGMQCSSMFADNVELTNDHREDVKYGHQYVVVSYDGDDVTIKSDSTITDMTVVIRDQYGNVMHQSTQTVGPAETTLYVPNTDGDSEKTTIDLFYDRRHLSGTFEE